MGHLGKFLPLIIILSLLLSLAGFASPVFADDSQGKSNTERLIVQFQPGTSWSEMIRVHQRVGGKIVASIPDIGVQVVTVPHHWKFFKSWLYRLHKEVRRVESDYVAQILDVPDDPYFDQQWGMTKVQAPEAWDITQGSADIRIAILDTGIDSTHPDLASKIVNKENFSDSDTVEDIHGHGTHCAGIAAALTNNNVGVAGLSYQSSLMNVKVLNDSGYGYYSSVAQGIIWATDHGADVVSMSLGGTSSSSTLEQAINYAWSHGVVVVAAAGNNGNSNPSYPAYYTNCIATAATDVNDNLASWSNHGDWVDVAAPGVSIYSTFPDGYKYLSGTSMATPHVAGLAALVFSIADDTNGNGYLNDEVRYKIEASADNSGIDGIGTGRINAYKAVQELSPTGQISGLVTEASTHQPVNSATITNGIRSTTTDSNGSYTLAYVPQGTYTVTASASHYYEGSQEVIVMAGETSIADFSITPKPNQAPILDPIGGKTVDEGQSLQFTVTASDPDGDTLTYSANNLPEGASFTGQIFSWTANYEQAGTYQVTFKVDDGYGGEDSKTITIMVNESLPGKISGTVTNASTGQPISSATITDGTRSATTNSDGSYIIADVPQGTYTLTASANGYQSAKKTVTVSPGQTTVADFQLAPKGSMWVGSVTFAPYSEGLLLKIKVVNPEPVQRAQVNGKVKYNGWDKWSFYGNTDSAGETTLRLRGAKEGEYLAIITDLTHDQYLWDKSKGITSASYTCGADTGQISGTVTDASTAAPIEGATVTDGTRSATTDSNGKYTITDVPEGNYTLTASANGYQNASQIVTVVAGETSTANFSLTPKPNQPPILDPIGDKVIDEGQSLQFTISASDTDGDTLTYSASNLPQGASFNDQTFTWTPDYGQAGTYQVTFTVSDGKLSDSETITITVSGINRAPILDPIGNKSVDEGQLLQFTISASDPDGDTLTYSASNLPLGASFANQVFSWTPDYGQAGTYQVTFTVSDGKLSDSETVTITVSGINRAPILDPIGDKSVNEGELLQFTISATDPAGDTLTYSASNLPQGASFAGQTFSWTPNHGQAGTYQVTFTVSDGKLSDSETITITVNGVNRAPVLDPIGDKSVNEGELLEFTISASDPDGDQLSYSASNLPQGASFAGQTFSWTPDYGQAGTCQVTFTISDGELSDSETVTITVNGANRAPVLDPIGDKSVNEGDLLQFTISASDLDGDQLTYSASNLPQGASFEGQTFSCTPDYGQAGTYEVTFTVSDGELGDSETITVQVEAAEPPSDSTPPVNEDKDLKVKLGRRNYSDGTYQVRVRDRIYDTDTGVRKVLAEVDGNIAFQADNINQPEYKFSFTTDLSLGTHSLIIDAWDAAGNHLHRTAEIQITRNWWMVMIMYWFTS